MEHLDVRQREVERGERAQYQTRVPGPPDGMAGDAPVRQAGQQTHVRPPVADPHIRQVARQMRAWRTRGPGRFASLALSARVLCGSDRLRAYALVMPCSRMMLPMRLLDAVTPFLSKAVLIFLAP